MPSQTGKADARDAVVVVVVLNWNGWLDTIACVESLLRSMRLPDHIIVCDNGSTDGSMERLRAWANGLLAAQSALDAQHERWTYNPVAKPLPYAEFTSIQGLSAGLQAPIPRIIFAAWQKNLGYAGANNVALQFTLEHLPADYVWILNNDTVVDAHALERQLELAQRDPGIGIVGAKLLMYHAPDTIQALGGGHWLPLIAHDTQAGRGRKVSTIPNVPLELDHVIGASLFVRTDAIRAVGFLDESYFLYREESDWCIEMRRHGWRMVCCTSATVWHKESASLGARSDLRDYYALRNMLYLIRKRRILCLPGAWLYFLARSLAPKIARLQFRRMGYVLRAYYDFARGIRGRAPFHLDELTRPPSKL